MKINYFDLKYLIAADYNFFYNMYKNNYKFCKVDFCIANYDIDFGISSSNFYSLRKEILIINGKWNSLFQRLFLLILNTKFIISKKVKKII